MMTEERNLFNGEKNIKDLLETLIKDSPSNEFIVKSILSRSPLNLVSKKEDIVPYILFFVKERSRCYITASGNDLQNNWLKECFQTHKHTASFFQALYRWSLMEVESANTLAALLVSIFQFVEENPVNVEEQESFSYLFFSLRYGEMALLHTTLRGKVSNNELQFLCGDYLKKIFHYSLLPSFDQDTISNEAHNFFKLLHEKYLLGRIDNETEKENLRKLLLEDNPYESPEITKNTYHTLMSIFNNYDLMATYVDVFNIYVHLNELIIKNLKLLAKYSEQYNSKICAHCDHKGSGEVSINFEGRLNNNISEPIENKLHNGLYSLTLYLNLANFMFSRRYNDRLIYFFGVEHDYKHSIWFDQIIIYICNMLQKERIIVQEAYTFIEMCLRKVFIARYSPKNKKALNLLKKVYTTIHNLQTTHPCMSCRYKIIFLKDFIKVTHYKNRYNELASKYVLTNKMFFRSDFSKDLCSFLPYISRCSKMDYLKPSSKVKFIENLVNVITGEDLNMQSKMNAFAIAKYSILIHTNEMEEMKFFQLLFSENDRISMQSFYSINKKLSKMDKRIEDTSNNYFKSDEKCMLDIDSTKEIIYFIFNHTHLAINYDILKNVESFMCLLRRNVGYKENRCEMLPEFYQSEKPLQVILHLLSNCRCDVTKEGFLHVEEIQELYLTADLFKINIGKAHAIMLLIKERKLVTSIQFLKEWLNLPCYNEKTFSLLLIFLFKESQENEIHIWENLLKVNYLRKAFINGFYYHHTLMRKNYRYNGIFCSCFMPLQFDNSVISDNLKKCGT